MLPVAVRELIKPMDLSNDELLKKCLYGKTQNNNESTNNLIQKRFPQNVYVGRAVLQIGTASAVINFNEGFQEFNLWKEKQHLHVNSGENNCELSERVTRMLTSSLRV